MHDGLLMKFLVPALLILTFAVPAAHADDAPMQKHKFNIPPSAELSYVIRARQSGFPIDGKAMVHWTVSGKRYAVANEARAPLFGKVLDSKSEGEIDEYGLAPLVFAEKRFRRDATTTSFDRDTHTIHFSIGDLTYPIKGGEQDRNSAIWQLISVARAAPSRFKPGTDWTFFVAGQRDAEPWTFKVMSQEKLDTPLGEVSTLHVVKAPPPDSKDQHVDIWLGPRQEWYPVRLRYTDADGDFIEQTLEQIRH